MSWLAWFLGKLSENSSTSRRSSRAGSRKCRPEVEGLEERAQPSVSTVVSNFNGTAIQPGSTLWFNSVMKVSGLGASPVTLTVTDGAIDFTAQGTPYHVPVPDTSITFTPGATSASTAFDPAKNTWNTGAPSHFSGNVFLAGVELQLPGGLPGGINPVSWQANFHTDTAGVTVNWQWAAAVYTSFSGDYNAVQVKPVDDNQLSAYKNSDHAGTPEAFRSFVVGGATGGGGSNFTGSYSATGHVTPDTAPPPLATATLSGTVHDSFGNPDAYATVTLTWMDSQGNHSLTTTTDSNGDYSFGGLSAGTYNVTSVDSLGATGGLYGVVLAAGDNSTNHNIVDMSGGGL
jgi:hypothetical protein